MTSRRDSGPPAWPYVLLITGWVLGSAWIVREACTTFAGARGAARVALAAPLLLTTFAASIGLFYLLGFVAKSLHYLALPHWHLPRRPASRTPPIAVLYLTAGDFDPVAVDSLLHLETRGPRLFLLHDDGADEAARARMQRFIDAHPRRPEWEVAVWHRSRRSGGKAGAVNWVLDRLDPRWQLLLLCDSDSIALDRDALVSAAAEFEDPGLAVVQFRNRGYRDPGEPGFHQRLAHAIDVFDVFAATQAVWGYLPFFGHNAVLRVEDLRRLGGFTHGFFSDDLDFSVRLTLAGRRIVYRRDLTFAERHPLGWLAFRKRARKWAFGCMQVVRARSLAVIRTPGIPLAHRLGLLEFMGFYPAQALLVAGLLVRHLVLPWLAPSAPSAGDYVAGSVVGLALISPTLAWALGGGRMREWPALAWSCALVYGGSILPTSRGVWDGLSSRERPWIPTNLAERRLAVPVAAWSECALGLVIVLIPWLRGDSALSFPASYLFVAVFLLAPLTAAAYREPSAAAPIPEPASEPLWADLARISMLVVGLGLAASLASAEPSRPRGPRLEVAHGQLRLDGVEFRVRGVHYSPWPPGTGPMSSPYPGPDLVERDLAGIRSLGANAVLLYDAPGWVIRRAYQHGLLTLYAFDITWNDTSQSGFDRQAAGVVTAVDSLRAEPGVVAWILGHEVQPVTVQRLGKWKVEGRLHALADRVRALDPDRLLGHGNWPLTKDLDLSFLDLACFNLYPAWPYEVVVKGYGPYLRDVLIPLARGRPLLITEFGINSLEAREKRQGEVLASCWRDIETAPTAGGVVFEWCDEWWKNYDNPVAGKDYWQRKFAPDDAARHDADPEEYYGIVGADRAPKPALAAVRAMWNAPAPHRSWLPWGVLAILAGVTWLGFGLGRSAPRRTAKGEPGRAGDQKVLPARAGRV